jgi:hypothetical protein
MPFYAALVAAAEDVLGSAGGMAEAPFALADPAVLRALAADAGWQHVEVSPRDLPIEFGGVADVFRAFEVTPVAHQVRALDAAGRGELAAALGRALAPLVDTDGAVRATTGTSFLLARA